MNPLAREDTFVSSKTHESSWSLRKRGQQIDTTEPFQVLSFAAMACKLTRHKLKRHVMK